MPRDTSIAVRSKAAAVAALIVVYYVVFEFDEERVVKPKRVRSYRAPVPYVRGYFNIDSMSDEFCKKNFRYFRLLLSHDIAQENPYHIFES